MNENKVVVIKERLINQDDRQYGIKYLVFSKTQDDAERWISENLDWNNGGDVWNQTRVRIEVVDDSGWWDLLDMLASKEVGFAQLKQIAKLAS